MLLEDFLKQFDGLDPKTELGISHGDYFNNKFKLKVGFVNSSLLREAYNPLICSFQTTDFDKKVLTIIQVED